MCKDELGVPPSRVGHDKQCDHDDNDTRSSPVDADLVDQVEMLGHEDVDQGGHQHDSPEAEDRLPRIGLKVLIEDCDCAQDQLGSGEVDTQRHGPIAHEGQPAVDEAHDGRILGRAQDGGPVVYTARSWIDGADFGERGGDAEGDERDEDPAPEDGD